MIRFVKGNGQTSPFLLDLSAFLAGEGTGIVVSTINSFAVVSGDVALGTVARAPTIVDSGASILFWLSAGTASTQSVFEVVYTTSAGSSFDLRFVVNVLDSLQ